MTWNWCTVSSNARTVSDCSGEEGAEPEGEAFDLAVGLQCNPYLWS